MIRYKCMLLNSIYSMRVALVKYNYWNYFLYDKYHKYDRNLPCSVQVPYVIRNDVC